MNSLLFVALELGKAILIPSTALIVVLAIGVTLLWSPWQRAGRWLATITGSMLVLLAILPLASWIAGPLERRFPSIEQLPDTVAGIVVLGGAFQTDLTSDWHQPHVNSYAERLIAFMALAKKYPNLQLVFSGGSARVNNRRLTESDIARDLFSSLGMDVEEILFENRSRNTCENAIYTAQLVKPLKQQTWVLITSAMDMPRAVGAFRKAGFQVLPYPVDYTTGKSETLDFVPTIVRNLARLDHAVHEWLGLIGYRLVGCSDNLFPGP